MAISSAVVVDDERWLPWRPFPLVLVRVGLLSIGSHRIPGTSLPGPTSSSAEQSAAHTSLVRPLTQIPSSPKMARRSSARLRERSTTPKRVSLSHDAPIRTPKTLPAKLSSLQESDEMPGAFPQSMSPSLMEVEEPASLCTPTRRTPIKPPTEEMHPQLHHQSTAKPREEARHLGFSAMGPHTEPVQRQTSRLAALQGTPTRNFEADLKSPSYEFTFRREHSLELSPEAKKLMHEEREEAAKIKAQMIADGEGGQPIDEMMGRKKATPGGRYSSVHLKEFAKMGSIAGHASAFRADPNRLKPVAAATSTSKSLKRSPSKAELDAADRTPSRPSSRETSKPPPTFMGSALPWTTSTNDMRGVEASSPAKRVKRAVNEDVSATRPASRDEDKPTPSTPQTQKKQIAYPNLSHLTTPTQSTLSRAASIKSTKTSKIPGPQLTPAKAASSLHKQPVRPHDQNTPLLHRSPSKSSFFPKPHVEKVEFEKRNGDKPKSMMDPHLARTPAKSGISRKAVDLEVQQTSDSPRTGRQTAPLLSRSPVKAPLPKFNHSADPEQQQTSSQKTPFLARSPSKIPMTGGTLNPYSTTRVETPGKSTATKLLGRFNLLRQSPIKSILRSPQRLYSDDPNKVAAGTHLATPPKKGPTATPKKIVPESARKHVDFSSSTKNGESINKPHPPPMFVGEQRSVERSVSMLPTVDYPTIPKVGEREERMLSPSPQKRRETAGPGDFTFRADGMGVVFRSPNAPVSSGKGGNTIRFVQTEALQPLVFSKSPAMTVTGSKKRKHEFEDRNAMEEADDDKENSIEMAVEEEIERPSKRMKASAPSPMKKSLGGVAPKKSGTGTLGVKPKGTKSMPPSAAKKNGSAAGGPTTISRARLDALSQPKKRG